MSVEKALNPSELCFFIAANSSKDRMRELVADRGHPVRDPYLARPYLSRFTTIFILDPHSSPLSKFSIDTLQPTTHQGTLNAEGFRFAIVASRWNDSLVSRLIAGALDALAELGASEKDVKVFRVPGSFEIPLCALKAAETGEFDAVICLGVIIRGQTPHFDYIAGETTRGIGEAQLKTGVPLLFGVITAENVDQAVDRAGVKLGNKGFEAATAAVELVNLYRETFEKR